MTNPIRWTRNEVKVVWRALNRLPQAHMANNRELTGISRQTLARTDAEGHATTAGLYDEATGRIVLFDVAFDLGHSGRSLDRILLGLIGESLWRTYRRHSLITDQARFGEAYARFYLEPEAFAAEDPVVYGRLTEALATAPDASSAASLPMEEVMTRARESMAMAIEGGADKTWVPGPEPLQRLDRLWPLVFVQGVGSLLDPEVVCAAVDIMTGAVYHRDPSAFEELLRVVNFPSAAASVDGRLLLTAWLVLSRGVAPSFLTDADGRDMRRPTVTSPQLSRDDRGDWLVDGWTREDGALEHHTLRITPSLSMTATVSRH